MIFRPTLFLLAICLLSPGTGLAETNKLQQPPDKLPTDHPKLSPLLKTSAGDPITTPEAWSKQREVIKQRWFHLLGGLPEKRVPLKPTVLVSGETQGFTRQFIRYQIEKNVFEDGYLLMPKDAKGRLPAIVVFHPTTPLQAQGVVGLSMEYSEEKWQGVQLVERGYIVWCPRNFIFDELPKKYKKTTDLYTANVAVMQEHHARWNGITRMTFDAIRAADFVCSLPNVDTNRIGCIGHSLGGKLALYAAAFDNRYKAAVSSEGGIGLGFSNWDAIWYHGPKIKEPGFNLENHEVLALIAPRAFLLLAGDSADGDKSWAFIEAVKPVYGLLNSPNNIGWFDHHQGHRYGPDAREVAEKFLDEHLK